MTDLSDAIFHNEIKAREHLERIRWPNGPFCPHCGEAEQVHRLEGEKHRPGLFYCRSCRGQFSVTVGTVAERSHIPVHKWLLAFHLIVASKKGMSAHQLSRLLDVSYKTGWFIGHRVREAMKDDKADPIGGQGRTVESDETVIGGKKKNRAYAKKEPKKQTVLTLVDRDGESRSFHIANVKAKTLRETIVKVVSRKSHFVTDELPSYGPIGKEFAGHTTVNHSANEYVRLGGFAHVNTAECRFSLMKRAVFGTHHSISEAHLHRYLVEWDFKFNNRKASDDARAVKALKGIEGKRLTYRRTDNTAHA
jgi:transposase-like protein